MPNNLPCAAINSIKSTSFNEEVRLSAKNFVNEMLKLARAKCHLSFLRACLQHTVIPLFIAKYFVNMPSFEHIEHQPALGRKLRTTKKEVLRCTISETEKKLDDLERTAGYNYT